MIYMRNISDNSKKWFILAFIFNLAAICLYGFLFWSVKEKNQRVSSLLNEIESREKQEQTLHSARSLAEDTLALREKVDSYIVEKDEAVSFIEMLESLGKERNVSVLVEAVEAKDIAGVFPSQEMQISLRAKGAWQNVVSFLGLVELLPYEAGVSRAFLSRDEQNNGWNGLITLRVLKEK